MGLFDIVRAAFPGRSWRPSQPLTPGRAIALGLSCLAWTALWVAVFDAHWVHHVDVIQRPSRLVAPCSTARWDVWATLVVAVSAAGTGYLTHRIVRDGNWVLWLA